MRFLVLAGCVIYGTLIGVFDTRLSDTQSLIFCLDAGLFGLFALHTHAHFKRDPRPEFVRRTLGLFADHGAALACLAVTGRDAGALAWLPLFIVQGVGIRFGVRWLFGSQAIGLASIGVVCAVNPFFWGNPTIALGSILSMLVLPLYFALLAQREARIKAALEEARLSAEAANEAKGRFVAMISHELRTPLTGIYGLNELLRRQSLPVRAQQMLAEQHAATSLMLTMVNDVLDLSKVEAGQMQVQLQEVDFDPQELALNVLQALGFQAKQKGLGVRVELDASLPIILRGSPFHVTRILQNLLGNAIKFTSEGSITLRIRRGEKQLVDDAVRIEFEVVDTGIGIPETALPKIFDRFYQVDAAVTRRFGGTGLGTSLVKEFCDLLQGQVRIESKLGKGTHCFVTLPFKQSQDATDRECPEIAGANVVACSAGIEDWPEVRADLLAAGAFVDELTGRNAHEVYDKERGPRTVLLMAGPPSVAETKAIASLGLTEAACVLLVDGGGSHQQDEFNASRLVTAGGSRHFLTNAVRLAMLGSPGYRPEEDRTESLPTSVAGPLGSLRVLVAEDTPTIQLFMLATLEQAGFAVSVVSDGAEALNRAMSSQFDVIVLDWNMPKIDGIDVVRRLREAPGFNALTPVVIATAAPSQQLVDHAMEAGALSVLGKPFAGDALVRAVNAAACQLSTAPVSFEETSSTIERDPKAAVILDVDALEGPTSIFRTVDPAKLISVFTRDVTRNRTLLQQAQATEDIALFKAAVHSLTGYAGALGARRLEALLATAPADVTELKARGADVVAELSQVMSATTQALDEWSKVHFCETH